MCGVFGAFSKEKREISIEQENTILSLLQHRGPDGKGSLRFPKATLLHTRLSIVDLSMAAAQPMSSRDGRWHIIFNGECYNYRDIKRSLEGKGWQFRTQSDTEVLLEAFICYGSDFIKMVNGIFALIIYDSRHDIAYIWRDRIGVKPLYWTKLGETIYFSSEIKPLLVFRRPELNPQALHSFFNLRYVVGAKTMFRDIYEVEPGSFTRLERGEIKQSKFWSIEDFKPQSQDSRHHQQALGDLIEDSVRLESQAEVTMGCFLSGGIDSGVIAAFSSKVNPKLTTFTLSTGLADDEADKAQQIASGLQLPNERIPLTANLEHYRQALFSLEDPIGDSILMPTWQLAHSASIKNKVVLSGEGADEIFSSYVHHQALAAENRILNWIPNWSRSLLPYVFAKTPGSVLDWVFPYPARLGQSGHKRIANHLNHLNDDFGRVETLISLFATEAEASIFAGEFSKDETRREYWDRLIDLQFDDKLKRLDLRFWASRYTLHRLDRLTMAHSMEARVPYFDHRLIEHMLSMPSQTIFSWRDPKIHFRHSLPQRLLPKEVVNRKKQAFFIPTEKVFSSKQILQMEEQILDNAEKRSVFDKKALEAFLRRSKNELLYYKQLQSLFSFEIWSQVFLDDSSPAWKLGPTRGIEA